MSYYLVLHACTKKKYLEIKIFKIQTFINKIKYVTIPYEFYVHV